MITETRLAVLDRSQIFCEGLKGMLDQGQDIQVVRIYTQLNEALRELDERLYDVLIISTNLIECSVSEAIAKVHKFLPQINIIVICDSGTLDECTHAVKAGAMACITRDISLKSFVNIIELVVDGNFIAPLIVADRLLEEIDFLERVKGTTRIGDIDVVTKREGAVLNLVAQGFKNREIADTLSISEQTVKVHLRNIMRKLHAHNRSQAVALTRARSGQSLEDLINNLN